MNKISASYYNALCLSLFVPYNLRCCKKHLETGMCSYTTDVQLPALWEKILCPFLFQGPRHHFDSISLTVYMEFNEVEWS